MFRIIHVRRYAVGPCFRPITHIILPPSHDLALCPWEIMTPRCQLWSGGGEPIGGPGKQLAARHITDYAPEDGDIGGEPARGSPIQATTGKHTEEVPVMDLQVAQTQAELQDLEERLKVLEFRKSDAVMKWKTGLGEKAVELLTA